MYSQLIVVIKLVYKALLEVYRDSTEDKTFSGTNFNSVKWSLIIITILASTLSLLLAGKVIGLVNHVIYLENEIEAMVSDKQDTDKTKQSTDSNETDK